MKSSSRKKILALLVVAVLAVAGVAFAALNAGNITSSPVTQATDLSAYAQYTPGWTAPARPAIHQGVNVQDNNVTLEGQVTLPVLVNGLSGAAGGAYDIADPAVYTVYNKLPINVLQRDAVAKADGAGMGVGGAILVGSDRVFTIRPGIDAGTFRNIGDPALLINAFTNLGILRIYGGSTSVFAPNNNAPTAATEWNNYAGGTFIWNGRLDVKHSNALGYGHVTAMADAVLGFDFNDQISFGGIPFQGAPSLGGLDGSEQQQLWVQRRNTVASGATPDTNIPWDRDGVRTTRRAAPVEFDVTSAVAGQVTEFTAHSGLRENIMEAGFAPRVSTGTADVSANATVLNSVQLMKTGEGTMSISNIGARHTGGTWVREGLLKLTNEGESGNRYVGELGYTWRQNNPALSPVETNTPQENFAAIDGTQLHLNNALRIDENATVRLNRDQFFGNFDGEGTFQVDSWARSGTRMYPQITVLLDRQSTNANDSWQKDSLFTGLAKGEFNLVLRGGSAKTGAYATNADNTKLTLAGDDNQITTGDTTIVDGTLSINSIGQLAPGNIRLGLAADDTNRGILATDAVPTLHGWGNFVVPQNVTTAVNPDRADWVGTTDLGLALNTDPRMRRLIPNLAADRGFTMGLVSVDLTRNTPDVLDNGVGYQQAIHFTINNQFGSATTPYAGLGAAGAQYLDGVSLANPVHTERTWAGTVAFTDAYTFPADSTAAQPFSAAVMNGVWHLEKTPIAGYSTIYISPGATLSFGSEARDFLGTATAGNTSRNPGMDIMVGANSRLRVKVTADDFKTSKEQATVDTAILKAAYIDYSFANSTKSTVTGTKDVGFQMGEAYKNQELVIELDLSDLSNKTIPAGTWMNVVTSYETTAMQALNYTLENGTLLAKVKFASTGTQDFDFSKAEAYVDVDSHSIIFYAKEAIAPTDPSNPPVDPTETTQDFIDAMSATEKAKLVDGVNFINGNTGASAVVVDATTWTTATSSINAYILDVNASGDVTVDHTYDGQTIEGTLTNASGEVVKTVSGTVTDGKVTFNFADLDQLPNGEYTLNGKNLDGNDVTVTLNITGGEQPSGGSGSSGCDAGFGAFALLALGAAVVLRKKD